MTAGDLPVTTGNPDQGFEGYRFVGYNLYDSLVLWDLSGAGDKASDIKPGLATEWHVDEGDNKRWIFTLRQGVKWHDGCPFTADDVVWNFGYSGDDKAPQFNPAQFAQARAYLGTYAGVEKIDDHTVAFNTKVPDSLFPYEMSYVLMISPCRAKEVKYDWTAIRAAPVGHRALQIRQDGAASAAGIGPEHRLLGQGAGAEAGSAGADPDAGGLDPHRGAAVGPGQLDRGAVARRDRPAEIGRDADRHQRLSAQLDVSAQFRQGPVCRQAGAPGGELRAQPRGHEGPAERADARSNTPPCRPRPRITAIR